MRTQKRPIRLPPDRGIIYIGAINSGTGRLWVDEFQMLVNGKDISEMARKKR